MVNHCCAYGCSNASDVCKNVKFHSFPLKNLLLLHKWKKAIRRKDFIPTKSTKICSSHFVADDYCRGQLKRTAVPSLFNFEVVNPGKSKKVLEQEEDTSLAEEPYIMQSELQLLSKPAGLNIVLSEQEVLSQTYILPDLQFPLPEPTENKCNTVFTELGLNSNRVELHFEDSDVQSNLNEKPRLLPTTDFNASYKEKGIQTLPNKCKMCLRNSKKFRLLRQQIMRKQNRIRAMKNEIASLKKELLDSKKRKIRVVGNSILLINSDKSYGL